MSLLSHVRSPVQELLLYVTAGMTGMVLCVTHGELVDAKEPPSESESKLDGSASSRSDP